MLAFKSLSTDLYEREGLPFNGNLVFFSTTSLNGNTSWTLTDIQNRYIRATNYSNVGTFFNQAVLTNTVITSAASGSHTGAGALTSCFDTGLLAAKEIYRTGATPSGGAHSHTIGISSFSNTTPKRFNVGVYKANTTVLTTLNYLPAGIVVLAESKPSDDFDQDSSLDNCYLFGSYLSEIGLSPGNSSAKQTFVTSSTGAHSHLDSSLGQMGDNDDPARVFPGQNRYGNYAGSGQTHTHTFDLEPTNSLRSMNLKYWKTTKTTLIANGIITGFTGTSSTILPKDWYLCNGQTVKGYTTPNLVNNNYIFMTSTGSHGTQKSNFTLLSFNYTSSSYTWTHGHKYFDNWMTPFVASTASHGSFDAVTYTHTILQDSGWQPDTYNIAFVIYLP